MSECLSGNDCQCAVDVSAIAWRNPSDHNSVELSIRTSSPAARQGPLPTSLARSPPPSPSRPPFTATRRLVPRRDPTPHTLTVVTAAPLAWSIGVVRRSDIALSRVDGRTVCWLRERAGWRVRRRRGGSQSQVVRRGIVSAGSSAFPRRNVKHTPVSRRPNDIDFLRCFAAMFCV